MLNTLLEMLAVGTSIQELLDYGANFLCNPMLICDTHFRIAYMSNENNLSIPLWERAKQEGYVSDEVLSDIQRQGVVEYMRDSYDPVYSTLPNGYHCIRCALRGRGVYRGFIGLYDYHRPFQDGDAAALASIGKAISALVIHDPMFSMAETEIKPAYLHQLLCCETPEQIRKTQDHFGADMFAAPMRLIAIRPESTCALPMVRLKDVLAQEFPHVTFAQHDDYLFGMAEKAMPEELLNYSREMHFIAGISTPFSDISFIHVARRQARMSLLYTDKTVYSCFEDVLPEEIRRLCLDHEEQDYFIHPIFRALRAYDAEYGVDYLHTLRVYLFFQGNLHETAQALEIHYNTMKHRLNVIEGIIGIRLRDDYSLRQKLIYSLLFLDKLYKYPNRRTD